MVTLEMMEQGPAHVLWSTRGEGGLEMVVRRPGEDEREVVTEATIEPALGLVGDSWSVRPRVVKAVSVALGAASA